jgi:Tol biopolymer transport system component/DNA-binding winged helix-turn-helix (wHTH) protein
MSLEPRDRFAPLPLPDRGAADFRLAGRIVRPALNRVETSEGDVSLEPKVMRVLLALARRPGDVVTKEELFRDVWDGAFVSEDVLTRAIGELRRLFGDDAASPRVIETIRKSGYRLIAPVTPAAAAGPAELPAVGAPTDRRGGLVAVAAVAVAVAAAIGAAFLLRTSPRRDTGPLRVRPLTSYPGNERDPALSPDGTRVAFAWNGGSGDAMSLFVQMVGGENPLRLTHEPSVEDRTPTWSPDGKRLAFTRATRSDCRIFLVSALGGEERPLAPCGDGEYRRVAWSPDGKWLALSRRDARRVLTLELLSPDTLERRPITRAPDGFLGDTSPAFSPDGETLAFTRNLTDGVNDIYRVPVSGGDPVRLTFDDRDTMGSDWSADGRSIVFSSSRAGIYSLWRVAAKGGGEPSWVAGGGIKMKHPSAARQGNLVAFENWLYEINLWRIPARAGPGAPAPRRLTEATDEWNFGPSLSADGARVVFVSTRSGSEEIWVAGSDGAGARRLTSFGGARLESPRLSPDGRRAVFSARAPARSNLYLVSADGGVVDRLTDESSDALAPRWSRDGRSVYFASRRGGGDWHVWRLDLEGHRLTPVTASGGYAAEESPDGRFLYFTRSDAAGIWRVGLPGVPGERAERVTDRLAPEDWANWQVGAAGIYFRELCPNHEDAAVALLPWDASTPRDLVPLPDQGWSGFAVSADGAWIVYPRVDRHTCDIRAIENPA